jgi:hypothetical protein
MEMDKSRIRKRSLHERNPSDLEYWLSQPVSARLEAVTFLMKQYLDFDDETAQRFSGPITITKRPLR